MCNCVRCLDTYLYSDIFTIYVYGPSYQLLGTDKSKSTATKIKPKPKHLNLKER